MAEQTHFANATAFVTGGASGIGRALAEGVAARGARVVLADRQLQLAEEVAAGIRSRGGEAHAYELDVRDADAFEAIVADVEAHVAPIDLFFNNAGIVVAGEAHQYGRRDWDDVLDVNVRGVVYGIQAVYPRMVARGRGHIVNTASVAGLMPQPGGASYTTSKHAVVGLSKALRVEGAMQGVRVSALCPGVIRTAILTGGAYGRREHVPLDDDTVHKMWERLHPMDATRFANEVLTQVGRNAAYIIAPRWWRLFWWLDRVSPLASMRLAEVLYRNGTKELRDAARQHPRPDDGVERAVVN